ncbi:MAG: hypothetical protein ACNA7H_13410, partial [Desulfotignum sp.]
TTLGLEKAAAGSMAESLFIQDLAELKTLSGGIGITAQGLEALGEAPANPADAAAPTLGKGPVLDSSDRDLVATLLAEIKTEAEKGKTSYPQIEEMVMDIKTLETQMLSPNPKTGIVKEVFRSLHQNLKKGGSPALTEKLNALI